MRIFFFLVLFLYIHIFYKESVSIEAD